MRQVLLVDDHSILRTGLKEFLSKNLTLGRILEASSVKEALEIIKNEIIHTVLLDINLPDQSGFELLGHIKRLQPHLPILVLSMYPEEHFGIRAIRAGAHGYLNKTCSPSELLKALTTTLEGKKYITSRLGELLAADVQSSDWVPTPHDRLSSREFEILRQIARGRSSPEIGEQLCLSKNTINTYRARILRKLKLKNTAELVRYAVSNRLD